jgi:hypothetical protein
MHTENNSTVEKIAVVPKIGIGSDDFKTLLLDSDVFVDKSLLIKEVLEDSGKIILITRPRRWGKSLNMDMVRRFLEIEIDEQGNPLPIEQQDNIKLFTGGTIDVGFDETKTLQPLKIALHKNIIKRQGQFPVLFITFKSVAGSTYEAIEAGIKTQLRNLFRTHSYLIDSAKLKQYEKDDCAIYLSNEITTEQIKNSLSLLTKLLYKHYNRKVWVLIDEYDTPINSAYRHFGNHETAFQNVIALFKGMMQSTFKKETGDKELPNYFTAVLC